jgi:8-oxo-dGTP diphosphatase
VRKRPASRILLIDENARVLLFRFFFKEGALAGTVFWATPGGEVDEGEGFEAAAHRELFEETGLQVQELGPCVAERKFLLLLPDGEEVEAHERFFLVHSSAVKLSFEHQTEEEKQVMTEHKWWTVDELSQASETVYPLDLADIVRSLHEAHVLLVDIAASSDA